MRTRLVRDEHGAEVVEFALVFPLAAFLIFGLIYGLFAVAAHVSLAHAASRGVRYASIPTDPILGVYPSASQVEAFVDDHTPFFTADRCQTSVTGDARENVPVVLDMDCDFPNPAGGALNGLRGLLGADNSSAGYSATLQMNAHAKARRE